MLLLNHWYRYVLARKDWDQLTGKRFLAFALASSSTYAARTAQESGFLGGYGPANGYWTECGDFVEVLTLQTTLGHLAHNRKMGSLRALVQS